MLIRYRQVSSARVMPMQLHKRVLAATFTAACALVFAPPARSYAQTIPARQTVPGHTANTKQEPCWQVAGISKSSMEQRKSILQNERSQVQSVCGNSSLTAQQRSEQIHQIHQQAKQQIDGLISASQLQSLHSCQASRATSHPSASHNAGGPCGELPGASHSTSPGAAGSKPEPEEPEN